MGTQLAKMKNTLAEMVDYIDQESVQKLYENMLGDNAGSYLASAVNLVRNDTSLQQCTPTSLKGSMMTPAILKLSIEKTLGHCFIIAYKDKAVFQIGYKGIIQLCIRSGKYQLIHCSEIYADELKSHNPITGQVLFHDSATFKMRSSGNLKNVIGHYAYFKLTSGFEKGDYMTAAQAMAHAKRFSQAYQNDLKYNKKSCPWSTDPIAMGNKTIIKRLLSKFGIMSVEMQKVLTQDDNFEAAAENARKKIDAQQGSEPVDAEFEQPTEPEEQLTPQQKAAATRRKKKEVKASAKARSDPAKFLYTCKDCGCGFDKPKTAGTGANTIPICRHCLSKNIVSTEDENSKPEFMEDEAA